MPNVAREGDMCTGHGMCYPRPAISGSNDVFVNNIPAHRVGDAWAMHCFHMSILAIGSPNVYVNGRPLGRVGDPIACTSLVATGSRNVYAND